MVIIVCAPDKDPLRNVMKKWNGVNTINGVFSGEFQLSDLPNLGEWKITAAVGDEVSFSLFFLFFFQVHFHQT